MRKTATRIAGFAFLLFAFLFQPEGMGAAGRIAWASAASVIFAGAMTYFSSPARIYILVSVFLVTAAFPAAVLFAIGMPTYEAPDLAGKVIEFISELASSLSGHYALVAVDFLLPTIICATSLWALKRLTPPQFEGLHANSQSQG